MKRLLPALAAAVFANLAAAQVSQTDFLVVGSPDPTSDVGGGIFLVDAAKGTSTPLANVTGDLRRASCILADPTSSSAWFVGTNGVVKGVAGPPNIYRITTLAGRVVGSKKLNTQTLTSDRTIQVLQLAGDKLVFGSDLRVATLPIAGGPATTLFSFFRSTNNFPAIACDGRYLYTNIYNNNGYRAGGGNVWRIDLQDISQHVSVLSVDQFPTNIRGLTIDSRGRLLVVDKGNFAAPKLRQFDLRTGKKLQDVSLPFQSLAGASFGEMDPNTETVVVVGQGKTFSDPSHAMVTVKNWTVGSFYGSVAHPLSGVASRRTPGLVRRGFVCKSTLTPPAQAAATSTPNVGNTAYSLDLLAPDQTVGIFLLGAGHGLPNPIKLAPTACELGVNIVLALSGAAQNGEIQLPLPIPSGVANVSLDVQWAVIDANANSLGLVTTQVGAVWIRP